MITTPAAPTELIERPWVLVVDDDAISRELVAAFLEPHGYRVSSVEDAGAALAILDGHEQPAVIVSDVMMPGMHGFDFCRRIRGSRGLQHLPVLCISAAGDRSARLEALEAGADDLLAKPLDDVELLARVRSMDRLRTLRVSDTWRQRVDEVLDVVGTGLLIATESGRVVRANASASRLLRLPTSDGEVDLTAHLEGSFARFEADGGDPADVGDPTAPGTTVYLAPHDRYVEVTTSRLEVPGVAAHLLLAVRDVTERIQSTTLADLVMASIGHKFRTPLTGLVSALELLEGAEMPEPLTPLIGIAARSAERLSFAVVRVIDAASVLSSTGVAAPYLLDANLDAAGLQETLGLREPVASLPISIEVVSPVAVDRAALRCVIDEYVSNARRAASGPDAIMITIRADDEEVEVTVEDDGPGVAPGLDEAVFSPFFQADRSGQGRDLGLGLALVQRLVSGAGGQVGVTTGATGPSQFTARLPNVAVRS